MSTTDAQYNAATELLKLVIQRHPSSAPANADATFALFQQCLAVVSGEWKPGAGRDVAVKVTCPACGEQIAVTLPTPK